jgi:3-oxoacyl-[acyl-carrier-protein] synthase III
VIACLPDGVRVGITGLGAYAPAQILTNEDLGRMIETSAQWIMARTGIEERRIAEPSQAASDLAVPAALAALERAAAGPTSVDLVIVATASPDMLFPATASLVAAQIGATEAAAFDLSAGCTGFVYALSEACGALAAGLANRVLVVGTEVLSRLTNWRDRGTCVLFGDAAGAAVVERVGEGGFLGFELGSDGARAQELTLPAGGSRAPASAETVEQRLHTIQMNGREIFRFSTRATVASVQRLLEACGLGVGDVDVYAPHQANKRIIDHVVARLGLAPEKVLLNIDRYGNTSAASIPLALAEASEAGTLQPGATVLLSGVGAGLTWGSALLRFGGERAVL